MELILKQPANKQPCICILFDNIYEASKLNQSFVNEHKTDLFEATFELQDSNLDLILKSEEGKLNYRYVKLKFDPDKLNNFLQNTKDATSINFCHIIFRQGKHEVVKTIINQALWVINVKSVDMVREY